MSILDVLNSPWAIMPAQLAEITEIYATHLRGEKIDIKAIEAQLGRPLDNEHEAYEVFDGVAVIPMRGVMSRRMNLFSRISGGVSSELLGRDIRAALEDPRVHSIILDVDSPGGQVEGTQTLANQVFAARAGRKPIVAFNDGKMASAAYWVASAADEVYLSGDTVITGSIGIVMQHADVSKQEEKSGVKITEIVAGKYKRIASEHAPLTEEGRDYMQAMVDQMYAVFVDAVARNRGAAADAVANDMADGRLFVGRTAIAAGLVDGVSTLDALIADLVAGKKPTKRAGAQARAA